MPDIREVLNALDENDRRLWSNHRTEMRRSYMTAQASVMGLSNWAPEDDAFIDLIDIKLAYLFDRSGRLETVKDVVHKDDAKKIENDIVDATSHLKEFQTKFPNKSQQALEKAMPNGNGWNGQ